MPQSLGINVGSSSLKLVLISDGNIIWTAVLPHEGDFAAVLHRAFSERGFPPGLSALVCGNEGRGLFALNSTIEPLCVEAALRFLGLSPRAVVSMGGEDLVVYKIGPGGGIEDNLSGSKCASGTGEFFKQQLARMDMSLEDVAEVPVDAKVLPLSMRCSVFMKSDCTHRLNKREASKHDIVLSLSMVMATKVVDFLKRARIESGQVLLTGGSTLNPHVLRFMRQLAPGIDFVVPGEAPYFEALGAAVLARESGSPLPRADMILIKTSPDFDRIEGFDKARGMVRSFEAETGSVEAGREYILGVDGGSTTTKACLIDMDSHRIVASHYGRTHGDPVRALKLCLERIREKIRADIGDAAIRISLAAATGSSREILGVFLGTRGVYNEIIAHAVGTTHFSDEVDTIFEIGGQDAKYVHLRNGVPIDYAMNEACSAGTGSFLEESAAGDLNIQDASQIGDIALRSERPLKFGEHCSAFINSDIRKAVQQGASREDITAGIVCSVVSNYLNRVVGNRSIGRSIFLQGGVAKNKAVPLAFAAMLGKPIIVPPAPELMGAFGVGLLAAQKQRESSLGKGDFDIDAILARTIVYDRVFTCASCDNRCPIQVLIVGGQPYLFGGRCNKYANLRRGPTPRAEGSGPTAAQPDGPRAEGSGPTAADDCEPRDWVAARERLMFGTFAPDPARFEPRRPFTVGIPRCFSVYSLYPLYARLFHELGIRTILSEQVDHGGVARAESSYCFPAEIAHGAVQDLWNKKPDYIFVPHFRDVESYEKDVHANFCPITQTLPYYIEKAFPEIPKERLLGLVVSFKFGKRKALEHFLKMGLDLGIGEVEMTRAFEAALAAQDDYTAQASALGQRALAQARAQGRPVIALLGRPYNAFASEANMGIPRKFSTRGYSVIPFDILPFAEKNIFANMYWYYGQQDMKVAALVKDEPDIYLAYISNFSCAPDSFILHYIKWMMGVKPFLVVELDSHSADAGIDTRIEAFLDIIAGYRKKQGELSAERYDNGLRFINDGHSPLRVENILTGERHDFFGNKRVKFLLSNMGTLSTELVAAVLRGQGVAAEALPVADRDTIRLARSFASGKECLPSHIVLGSALRFFASEAYCKDDIYLLFVPITTGPCRTGQYFVFLENVFRDMRLANVVVVTLSADNSYNEFGPDFSKKTWFSLVIGDYMKDLHNSLRACAQKPDEAVAWFSGRWRALLDLAERDFDALVPALRGIAKQAALVPLARKPAAAPKVLVVGEIYVRRDDFAVDELTGIFASKGIIAKVAGIGEWIHYLDFVREYEIKKKLRLLPLCLRPFSEPARKLARLKIEEAWKHHVENRIIRALSPSGLLINAPRDMRAIMARSEKHFVNLELSSEIVVSSGAAAAAMDEDFSGIVNISPFACLIGRVIEGLVGPWARERGYPLFSVEVDGNPLPPALMNKLNIFMVKVLRYKKGGAGGLSALVERHSAADPAACVDGPSSDASIAAS